MSLLKSFCVGSAALLASEFAAYARSGLELFAAQFTLPTPDSYFVFTELFNFGEVSSEVS